MRVLTIENFRKTPLGIVGEALREAGVEIEICRAYLGEEVPDSPAGYDGLVVLGGEQSALDDEEHPFLPKVAALTRAFGEKDKAVLGICLGSQLIARGHGAENILGRPVEFGWREVTATEAGEADPLLAATAGGAPLFHWHTDTFALPEGALHLAMSAMTRNQAFKIGRAVYGLQFHFEADRRLVESWSRDFAEVIAGYAPDWPERHPLDAATLGAKADMTGMAIARAWVKLIR